MRRFNWAFLLLLSCWSLSFGEQAEYFTGQDFQMSGTRVITQQISTTEQVLLFPDGFKMEVGGNEYSSGQAVVEIKSIAGEYRGKTDYDYSIKAYLANDIKTKKYIRSKSVTIAEADAKEGQAKALRFVVSGQMLVTVDKKESGNVTEMDLFKKSRLLDVETGPRFTVQKNAIVPTYEEAVAMEEGKLKKKEWFAKKTGEQQPKLQAAAKVKKEDEAKEAVKYRYAVNFAPLGTEPLKIETVPTEEGLNAATITQSFYVWQKLDENGRLLELKADSAVVFYAKKGDSNDTEQSGKILGGVDIKAVYLAGNVVMTEDMRTVKADELYYDFEQAKAIAVNAEFRTFDVSRNIPIYIRAAKMRKIAENQFSGENIVLTTSEFYKPQISMTASEVVVTDTTAVDQAERKLSDSSFTAEMKDVRFKYGDTTLLKKKYMKTKLERPDLPIRRLSFGSDSRFGTYLESEWYLSRLLGLKEPDGVDSRLLLDYFSKRGVGAGAEIKYENDDSYGEMLGYMIDDHGEDRLGRISTRKHIEPDNELRGRFSWRHRQFLADNWQLTTGVSYLSDENFLESFYRREFNVGDPQETYAHLKKIQDNWGVSVLVKGRINDFADEMEQYPTVEHHLAGQSLMDDTFTYYADSQLGAQRYRVGDDHDIAISEENYTYGQHRSELDLPIWLDPFKVVPYAAGTYGYDDRSGFRRSLVDGTYSGSFGQENIVVGETGLRASTQMWKVYPGVKSRLWDLNQLRHIIRPSVTAALYEESTSVIEQRNMVDFGLSQRLQTKRGVGENQRTVDWMRLNTDLVLVSDSDHDAGNTGPDRFIWNTPMAPMRIYSGPEIFNTNLESQYGRVENWGPRRNYMSADYIWRVSDTTAVLSDMYYDTQSGIVQQMNVGYSKLVWPNLSYYLGSRYLKRLYVGDEVGSNAVTFAITYKFDPRYTLVFAQQYDFDYGHSVRSEMTLIRKYHRMYTGFSVSVDESISNNGVMVSIWPEGVPEIGLGDRGYTKIGGMAGY